MQFDALRNACTENRSRLIYCTEQQTEKNTNETRKTITAANLVEILVRKGRKRVFGGGEYMKE